MLFKCVTPGETIMIEANDRLDATEQLADRLDHLDPSGTIDIDNEIEHGVITITEHKEQEMKPITGYMIFQNGSPLDIDVCEDLRAESADSPFPVFLKQDDAEETLSQVIGLHVDFHGGSIVPVTITFGETVITQEQVLADRGLIQNEDGSVDEIEEEDDKYELC